MPAAAAANSRYPGRRALHSDLGPGFFASLGTGPRAGAKFRDESGGRRAAAV